MRQRKRGTVATAGPWLYGLLVLGLAFPAGAQNQGLVVRDGSIGPPGAGVVLPGDDEVGQHADYLIRGDLGEQRGGNLFHSFERFSIGTGETATFTAQGAPEPGAIGHVISRVTGLEESSIDGTLRSTIAGADVWLMNPNGLVFGQNASLDVPAGFHASTADSLELSNGEVFEVRAAAPLPVLAVDPPEAFGFLGDANVHIDGLLGVPEGETLSLAAGGAVEVRPFAVVDAPGGMVHLQGGQIAVDGSVSTDGFLGSAGSVRLEARDDALVTGGVSASGLFFGNPVDGGSIQIDAGRIDLSGFVAANGWSDFGIPGNGGSVRLAAREEVVVTGGASASSASNPFGFGGFGNGGSVEIEGQRIEVSGALAADGASSPFSFASGDGGSLRLMALGEVVVAGSLSASALPSQESFESYGSGGSIHIEGDRISVEGTLAAHGAGTDFGFGGGNGGSLRLVAADEVVVAGSLLASDSASPFGFPFGNGGSIEIESGRRIAALGNLAADGFLGGAVRLIAGDEVDISGTVSASTRDSFSGGGGAIEVEAPLIGLSGNLFVLSGVAGEPGRVVLRGTLEIANAGLIERDGLLGSAPAGVVPGGISPDGLPAHYLITPDLGEQSGSNLFHSFLRFGLAPGEIATFTGPDPLDAPQSVHNVLARVTGGEVSQILGTIRTTIPGAALWLLNPAGWVFGSGARLDVTGALHVGTAEAVAFDSEELFEAAGVLSVPQTEGALPSGFVISPDNDGSLRVDSGALLRVRGGEQLALEAPHIAVVGELSADAVFPSEENAGSIRLVAREEIDLAGFVSAFSDSRDGGAIEVAGRRIDLSGFVSAGSSSGNAGSVRMSASDAVTISSFVNASSFFGDGGAIEIQAGLIDLRGQAHATCQEGQAGSIRLLASDEVRISGGANASTSVSGSGGVIEVEAPRIALGTTAQLLAGGGFSGTPGRVTLRGEVTVLNAGLVERDGTLGGAPAGIVAGGTDPLGRRTSYLITPDLGEQRGANLLHSFLRFGLAPNEIATFTGPDPLDAPQSVRNVLARVTGGEVSEIRGTIRTTIPGAALWLLNPAGWIFGSGALLDVTGALHFGTADAVAFDSEELFEAAAVLSGPQSEGALPSGFVIAPDNDGSLRVDSGAFLRVRGGEQLALEAPHIAVAGGLRADGDSFSADAGSVRLVAREEISVTGSVAASASAGAGGAIELSGRRIDVFGSLSAGSSSGNAGSVRVSASEAVTIPGFVGASTSFSGTGGTVEVQAGSIDVAGQVRATASLGSAGSVLLTAQDEVSVRGTISTSASGTSGIGGLIEIEAPRISFGANGQLLVNGGVSGRPGQVTLRGEVTVPNAGLVERDGTLGGAPAGIVAGGIDPLGRPTHYLITPDLGEQRGANLLHSFLRFGLAPNEIATFTGPDPLDAPQSVRNVLARVTGGEVSEIRGTIRTTIPEAALWLLNPAGWIFASGARLDVMGALHVGTAQAVVFDSEELFEAAAVPQTEGALPSGFVIAPDDDGSLRVDSGAFLRVRGGEQLALEAPHIAVAGGLRADGDSFSADAGSVRLVAREEISVTGSVTASASAGAGGAIELSGRRIDQTGIVSAGSSSGNAGSVQISASDAVTISGSVSASTFFGDGGAIEIQAGSIDLPGQVQATAQEGNGGSVRLLAEDEVGISGRVDASTTSFGFGNGGNVRVAAERISVGGFVLADSHQGDGGTVLLTARDEVSVGGTISASGRAGSSNGGLIEVEASQIVLDTGSRLLVDGGPSGAPGTIILRAGGGPISNHGLIETDGTVGDVPAGIVAGGADPLGRSAHYLITPDLGEQRGANLLHSFLRFGLAPGEIATFTGPDPLEAPQSVHNVLARVTGGEVSQILGTIRTTIPGAALWLLNPAGWVFGSGARLDVTGALHVGTAEAVAFDSEELFEAAGVLGVPQTEGALPSGFVISPDNDGSLRVESGARLQVGGGEQLALEAPHLAVIGQLGANGSSSQDAGSVRLVAREEIGVTGSVTASASAGLGGAIELSGSRIDVFGSLSADSSSGNAGSVRVSASDAVTIPGLVSASTSFAGNGGTVEIQAGSIDVLGQVRANASTGSAGSVLLTAQDEVAVSGMVSASASGTSGNGGLIEVDAPRISFGANGQFLVNGGVSGTPGQVTLRGELTVPNAGLVERDGTLGGAPAGIVAGGADPLGRSTHYLIAPDLGEQLGAMLLHSFLRFGLAPGEIATFTGPDPLGAPQSVSNVIARVTGGEVSEILGTIRTTIPGAALWLLNPAGWIFGSGARLDLTGAFHVGAVEAVAFDGDDLFESSSAEAPALAATSLPAHFVRGPEDMGSIQLEAAHLRAPTGQSLALTAGDEVRVGAGATVSAPSGEVELEGDRITLEGSAEIADAVRAHAAGTLTIDGNVNATTLIDLEGGRVDVDGGLFAEEVRVRASEELTVDGTLSASRLIGLDGQDGDVLVDGTILAQSLGYFEEPPSIEISGRNVELGGFISANADGADAPAGHLSVEAQELLRVLGYITLYSSSDADAGSVKLRAGDIEVIDAAFRVHTLDGSGHGGTIDVEAARSLLIRGGIEIAPDLRLGAGFHAGVFGDGLPGKIFVRAPILRMEEGASINTATSFGIPADGGAIELRVSRLEMLGLTGISSSAFGSGSAGPITIDASESILVSNEGGGPFNLPEVLLTGGARFTGIFAASLGSGASGSIELHSPRVEVTQGGFVATATLGSGAGGPIEIHADEVWVTRGGAIDSSVAFGGEGGTILIDATRSVRVEGRHADGPASRIRALATGNGDAGSITILTPELMVDAGAIASSSLGAYRAPFVVCQGCGVGAAGQIDIEADWVSVVSGGRIDSSSFGAGLGGDVEIRARELLSVTGEGSAVIAKAAAVGAGGSLVLDTGRLEVMGGGALSTESRPGPGGSRPIFADLIDSGFVPEIGTVPVATGASGSILIDAGSLSMKNGRIVAETTGPGAGGSVSIRAVETTLSSGGEISTLSTGAGAAGAIELSGERLRVEGGAINAEATTASGGNIDVEMSRRLEIVGGAVTASVTSGSGGNVTLTSQSLVLDHATVVAEAGEGSGGNIDLTAEVLIANPESLVSASSKLGISGTVEVHAPDVDLAGSLAALADSALDASDQLAERCSARGRGEGNGSFTVAGAGLRPGPEGWLSAWSRAGAEPSSLAASSCH